MERTLKHDVAARAATISVRGLTKRFGAHVALAPLDLELGPGGIVGLLGPNGSGKSTFLRLLTGLVPRTAGAAQVAGVELVGDGTQVRERASYAPGEIGLYRELRARDHLAWFLRGRDAGALPRALTLAAGLGLPLEKRVRAYSHGMKRQLMVAAALAPDVPVRILDEPTEGLDPSKRGEVVELLRADAGPERLILLSSHHLGEVDRVCERLVFLDRGVKIADERAAELHARAQRLVRATFEPGTPLARVVELAPAWGARSASARGDRVVFELADGDARVFLARAAADVRFPRPTSVEYGQLSLAELYRDLYGVEGC